MSRAGERRARAKERTLTERGCVPGGGVTAPDGGPEPAGGESFAPCSRSLCRRLAGSRRWSSCFTLRDHIVL